MPDDKPTEDTGQQENSFVPFYERGAQLYMSLKLSKDGLSRVEDTDVLKGMYTEFTKEKNIGAKLRRHLNDVQQDGNE